MFGSRFQRVGGDSFCLGKELTYSNGIAWEKVPLEKAMAYTAKLFGAHGHD